jgi:hypothetical protein
LSCSQIAQKVVETKFPGERQRKTPAADIGDVVYILSKLPGEMGKKLSELGAATTTGLIGGDLRLAEATEASRLMQDRLAKEDPNSSIENRADRERCSELLQLVLHKLKMRAPSVETRRCVETPHSQRRWFVALHLLETPALCRFSVRGDTSAVSKCRLHPSSPAAGHSTRAYLCGTVGVKCIPL